MFLLLVYNVPTILKCRTDLFLQKAQLQAGPLYEAS